MLHFRITAQVNLYKIDNLPNKTIRQVFLYFFIKTMGWLHQVAHYQTFFHPFNKSDIKLIIVL